MMDKKSVPEVVFEHNNSMEHMIIWSESGYILDDSLKGYPKLSAIDVLKNLAENGIISLEVEDI